MSLSRPWLRASMTRAGCVIRVQRARREDSRIDPRLNCTGTWEKTYSRWSRSARRMASGPSGYPVGAASSRRAHSPAALSVCRAAGAHRPSAANRAPGALPRQERRGGAGGGSSPPDQPQRRCRSLDQETTLHTFGGQPCRFVTTSGACRMERCVTRDRTTTHRRNSCSGRSSDRSRPVRSATRATAGHAEPVQTSIASTIHDRRVGDE